MAMVLALDRAQNFSFRYLHKSEEEFFSRTVEAMDG